MPNRIITAAVTGETIKLSNKTAGAAGSFNAVSLSLTFDSAWDGTTKKLYFFDAYGNNAVYRLLTTELLVDGAYVVPIPAEPLAYAGEMTITIRGIDFATDGTTAERIIMSASTTMKVLSAIAPASDVAPVEPTPTQAEQLQGEIDDIKATIANAESSVSAASASASAAANSATEAATSATAAQTAQTAAESARDAAISAKTGAQTAETNAGTYATNAANSAAAAASSASAASSSASAADSAKTAAASSASEAATSASNAASSATAAATSATNADNARIAAQTAQTNAETSETNAETAAVNAKTAETNAVAAKNAAELALTHAPYIDDTTGNWFIWNATTSAYVDSGTYATGATGAKGDKGDKGDTGATGNGIASVARTSGTGAAGTTDTYTITFTDSTTTTFGVYNGANGTGAGDMLAATYDPNSKNADAFDMTNMVEGTTNKIFTATERTKLSGIADNANNYIHPSTHSADIITDGTTNKAYTAAEKTKLAGIATGANKYTHPANHPPSIITQDESNRFVTDAEKAKWNGKANPPTAVTATLSTTWEGSGPYTQSVTVSGVTSTNIITVSLASTADETQRNAARDALLSATAQATNSITVTADGDKPMVALPIQVLILGG